MYLVGTTGSADDSRKRHRASAMESTLPAVHVQSRTNSHWSVHNGQSLCYSVDLSIRVTLGTGHM